MNILAVDTTGSNLNVLALKNGESFFYARKDAAKQHSVYIYDAVDEVLKKSGLNKKEIDIIASVTGPGSFTGIRIGVCAVKALCFALNKKCAALTSLKIAAYYEKEGITVPVISAGRGNCYYGAFNNGGEIFTPRFGTHEEAEKAASELKGSVLWYDENDARYESAFRAAVTEAVNSPIEAVKLTPLYLRLSQAEREAECK